MEEDTKQSTLPDATKYKSRSEMVEHLQSKQFARNNTDKILYPHATMMKSMLNNPNKFQYGKTNFYGERNTAIKDYANGDKSFDELSTALAPSERTSEQYKIDSSDLLNKVKGLEDSKNFNWTPAQEHLIQQRRNGEFTDDTFANEIQQFKYGEFGEFHEKALQDELATPVVNKMDYKPNGIEKDKYKQYLKDNKGRVNRATLNNFLDDLQQQQPLITVFEKKQQINPKTKRVEEVTTASKKPNDELIEGFGKLANTYERLYKEKGVLPKQAFAHFTPEENEIYRQGQTQLRAIHTKYSQNWVSTKDGGTDRSQVQKIQYPNANINSKALEELNSVEHDVDWSYLNTNILDKNKASQLLDFKEQSGGKNLSGIKMDTTYDSRGRNYQNYHLTDRGEVVVNPLANQDIKTVRAMISLTNKQPVKDLDELKIHTANTYGKDKLTYNDRIKWFDENEPHLDKLTPTADEPEMYKRAVDEYTNHKQGKPSGLIAYADAISSGIQIKAALHGDPHSLRLTGATNTERPDIYSFLSNELNRKGIINKPIPRAVAKDAILVGGYGSSQVGRKIVHEVYKRDINKVLKDTPFTPTTPATPQLLDNKYYSHFKEEGVSNETVFRNKKEEIDKFHHDREQKKLLKRLGRQGEKVLRYHNKYPGLKPYTKMAGKVVDYYKDTLKSEARFNDAILDVVDKTQDHNKMTFPDLHESQVALRKYEFENTSAAKGYLANYVHGYDGWITREVTNLGKLDKGKLQDIRRNRTGHTRMLTMDQQKMLDQHNKTGYLSSYFLNDLDEGRYNSLKPSEKIKVDYAISRLPDSNYEVKLVHDSFGTHPNNMKDVKQQYTNVLQDIYRTKGKLLQHTFKEWTGKELPYTLNHYEEKDLFNSPNYLIN